MINMKTGTCKQRKNISRCKYPFFIRIFLSWKEKRREEKTKKYLETLAQVKKELEKMRKLSMAEEERLSRPKDTQTESFISKKENVTVKTNVGRMPLEDYLEIVASQHGYDSYEDMKADGLYVDTSEYENS